MRHVALLIETSGSYGRGLLAGIAKYNREHGGWSTYFRPHGLGDRPPEWLKRWSGDGMLVRIDTREMADLALQSKAEVVNLRGTLPGLPIPFIAVDNEQVARLAFQHLVERGFKNFAFCGQPRGGNPSLDQRADYFREIVEEAGHSCHIFAALQSNPTPDWEDEQDRMASWIRSLPKPVGVMACNDERGMQLLDAARRCGATVPDEVAVIGVDNDAPLCDLSIPPLTSVDVNAEGIGYEAAALLDRMMGGKKVPAKPVKMAPRGVITRRSTDVIASEDEEVNRAVSFIRENACKGLQVMDVLSHLGMSRASLQQRMKLIAGRTIHQEIQRVRLERAKQLLVMSGLTIKQIARESGFASVQYMTRMFRSATGETPAKYRSRRTT